MAVKTVDGKATERHIKRKKHIKRNIPKGNNSSEQFLGVLFALFGIFLLWSAFLSFQENPSLFENQTTLVGSAGGIVFLVVAYLVFRE